MREPELSLRFTVWAGQVCMCMEQVRESQSVLATRTCVSGTEIWPRPLALISMVVCRVVTFGKARSHVEYPQPKAPRYVEHRQLFFGGETVGCRSRQVLGGADVAINGAATSLLRP